MLMFTGIWFPSLMPYTGNSRDMTSAVVLFGGQLFFIMPLQFK